MTARTAKRLHVFWTGRVQGVGFRFMVESAALELNLTGWVKNLPDGRVEAAVEGPDKALKRFLEKVAQGPMKPHIRSAVPDFSQATGEFEEFQVRFY